MCPGEKVESPQTAYEKAFYPKHYASKASLLWLERKVKQSGKHIHHAMCGHGGERWINGARLGTTLKLRRYTNTTAVPGMGAEAVSCKREKE